MIKAIIVEDEQLARELIKDYLGEYKDITLLGEYEDGFSGLKAINELKPDLVFLDIQMPKLTGFEMLELLDHRPAIIFTTAYDQYAIKAFEHNTVDYLLKPFSKDRFREAIDKVTDKVAPGENDMVDKLVVHMDRAAESIHRVVVKTGSRINVIPVDEITYIEAQDDYVMIYTPEKKYLKQKTMKFFEAHLPREEFVRIHRSYIARISQIAQMELYEKDSYIVIMKNGTKLPVSKTGLPKLKKSLDF